MVVTCLQLNQGVMYQTIFFSTLDSFGWMTGPTYRHTQLGYVTLTVTLLVALAVAVLPSRSARSVTLGVASLLAICAVLFSSLTVEITGGELRFHFGPGFWRKRFPLTEVAAANPTRTSWWEGWGIRITPRGVLYNVSGTNAVEIELQSGKRFRIGTDQPDALVQAVRTAIGAPPV
jgi:hypothetical protein